MWALRHTAYKGGLDWWGMSAFISAIPLVIHAALFLFLVGLCLRLWPLDVYIAALVVALTSLISVAYVVFGIAPLFWGDCPSATPGLRHLCTLWDETITVAAVSTFKVLVVPVTVIPTALISLFTMCAVIVQVPGWFALVSVPIRLGASPRWEESCRDLLISFTHSVKQISRWFGNITNAVCQYRPKSTRAPAFDQAKFLAADKPLQEAVALSWIIRMLPAEDDVTAALCAIGSLSAADHHDYFYSKNKTSPLMHEGVQRAVEDTLERIAARPGAITDATIASLLRACVSVSVRSPKLSATVKEFLSTFAENEAYDIGLFARFICSNAVTEVQDGCPDAQWTVGRLAIIACEMCEPQRRSSIALAIQSHVNEDIASRQSSNRIDDPHVDKLIRVDTKAFGASRLSPHYDPDLRGLLDYSAAAERVKFSDATSRSRDLQDRLRFITTPTFLASRFSAAHLNNIAAVLLLANPEGLSCIRPVMLRHLLYHFEYRGLTVRPDTLLWIRAAFQLLRKHIDRTLTLWQYIPAETILPGSHLSLLRPISITLPPPACASMFLSDISKYPTSVCSPWSQMLSIMPLLETAEMVSEMGCAYSILLLAMYRRGFAQAAQAMLRELLPHEYGAMIIAYGTRSRHHLALHARIVDASLWEQIAEELLLTQNETWTACEKYPDAGTFVDAIAKQSDCTECPQEKTEIEPGWAHVLASTSRPKGEEVEQDPNLPVTAAAAEPPSQPTESPNAPEEEIPQARSSLVTAAADEEDQLEKGQRAQ